MANGNEAAAQMMAGQMMGGPAGPAVDPAVIEKGRGLIYELTDLITSDPNVMLALKDDLIGFGMTIKQFAGGGGAGGQPGQGPPGPGMGAGMPPGASPMGGPPGGGPPMGGPPPGGGQQGF